MDVIKNIRTFGPDHSKQTLILIPGGPGLGPEYLVAFAQMLATDKKVVLVRSGYSCYNEHVTIEKLGKELELLIYEYSQNSEVILLAHSGGATIVLELLSKIKNLKMILVSWIYDMNWLRLFYQYNPNASKRIDDLIRLNSEEPNSEALLKNRIIAFLPDYFKNPDVNGVSKIFEKNSYYPEIATPIEQEIRSRFDFVDAFNGSEQPILSIIGGDDRVIFPEYYDLLPDKVRTKIDMHVLENSGHFPFIDQPCELIELINEFLNNYKKEEK